MWGIQRKNRSYEEGTMILKNLKVDRNVTKVGLNMILKDLLVKNGKIGRTTVFVDDAYTDIVTIYGQKFRIKVEELNK